MQNLKEKYSELIKSKEFQNDNLYLCSVFKMAEPKNIDSNSIQFSFYNKENKRMTSYIIGEIIHIEEEQQRFVLENEPEELNLNSVKIDFNTAFQKAESYLKEKSETAVKIIAILQQNKIPFWNITFTTSTFHLANIQINAEDGSIIEKSFNSLLSFGKGV